MIGRRRAYDQVQRRPGARRRFDPARGFLPRQPDLIGLQRDRTTWRAERLHDRRFQPAKVRLIDKVLAHDLARRVHRHRVHRQVKPGQDRRRGPHTDLCVQRVEPGEQHGIPVRREHGGELRSVALDHYPERRVLLKRNLREPVDHSQRRPIERGTSG